MQSLTSSTTRDGKDFKCLEESLHPLLQDSSSCSCHSSLESPDVGRDLMPISSLQESFNCWPPSLLEEPWVFGMQFSSMIITNWRTSCLTQHGLKSWRSMESLSSSMDGRMSWLGLEYVSVYLLPSSSWQLLDVLRGTRELNKPRTCSTWCPSTLTRGILTDMPTLILLLTLTMANSMLLMLTNLVATKESSSSSKVRQQRTEPPKFLSIPSWLSNDDARETSFDSKVCRDDASPDPAITSSLHLSLQKLQV